MKDTDIHEVIRILSEAVRSWDVPIVTLMSLERDDPFRILIATILSLRTKDETTAQAARRLFARATTPVQMRRLSAGEIEKTIYPVGFYRRKARNILEICDILLEEHDGRVPDDIDTLLTLPGVGRKTANRVVTHGYKKPGICVDTHVHRISNRFGYVETKTPEETEFALREKLPKEYWICYNDLLVAFGQHLCRPISPHCSRCPVARYCGRVGVEQSR